MHDDYVKCIYLLYILTVYNSILFIVTVSLLNRYTNDTKEVSTISECSKRATSTGRFKMYNVQSCTH